MAEKKAKEELTQEPTLYEVGILLTPQTSEEGTAKHMEDIRALIEKAGGVAGHEGAFSLIKLAYPMTQKLANKKTLFESAYFGWVQFRAGAQEAEMIGKSLRAKEEIIRFLLTKTEEVVVRPPRIIPQASEETGEVQAKSESVSDAQLDEAIKELVS